jgi:hypothetical protein
VHGPGGWTTSPIVNRDPAVLRDPATKLSRPVHCTCPHSPWGDGPTGPYWLSCVQTCRACNPRTRRRPRVGPIEANDPS